jgi:hypothetical protein
VTATSEFRIGLRAAIGIAVLAAAFLLPSQAFADSCSNAGSDPTAAQYCSSEVVIHESPSTPTPSSGTEAVSASSAPTSGSLPFTGLDLAALIAAAAVLTGTGLALRRISKAGSRQA